MNNATMNLTFYDFERSKYDDDDADEEGTEQEKEKKEDDVAWVPDLSHRAPP